jgi:hypothetical protein
MTMVSEQPRQWYDRQKARDGESTELSESLLGSEKAIFVQTMSLLALLYDSAITADKGRELLDDLAFKRKISLVHYGFNLLWSAWTEALAGRYHTATDHWRSIDESGDYLLALEFNPQLAEEMTDIKQIKIKPVRQAIKRGLSRGGAPGNRDLLKRMQDVHQYLDHLSHITVESLGQYLPVKETGGQLTSVVRPGGAVSQLILRHVAIHLAMSALKLLMDAMHSFEAVVGTELQLQIDVLRKIGDSTSVLGKELEALHAKAPRGPVTAIYLARSNEEI